MVLDVIFLKHSYRQTRLSIDKQLKMSEHLSTLFFIELKMDGEYLLTGYAVPFRARKLVINELL